MSFLNLSGVADGALPFVANWLIQSTLLIMVGLAVAATLRGRGAAVQSAVYRITLAAVLVAPVATWIWSGAGVTGWSVQPAIAVVPASSPAQAMDRAAPSRVEEGQAVPLGETPAIAEREAAGVPTARDAQPQPAIFPEAGNDVGAGGGLPVGLVICLAWAGGSGWLLVRLLRSARGLSRLRGSALPADPGALALLKQLSGERGVAVPELLRTPLIDSACLVGVRRPAIFLPEETMALPLRDVLVHELGHLRRRDCLWHWISQLAVAVFFFQPLLWLLARRMEAAAEEVCDNCVLEAGIDSREYATRLVELAEQSHAPLRIGGIGIVPVRSLLPGRIRRLLDPEGVRATVLNWKARTTVIGGGLTAVMLAGFIGVSGSAASDDVRTVASGGQVLRGVVRNAEGQPIANAPVYLVARVAHWESRAAARKTTKPAILDVGQTDEAGRFEVVAASDPDGNVSFYRLVAAPAGHGIAFGPYLGELDEAVGGFHEIVADKAIPISGRLVSPEGEPVRGASISLTSIEAQYPSEEWGGIGVFSLRWIEPVFEFWPAPVKTDANGSFSLRVGAPKSVARLLVEADGHAPARLVVVPPKARPAFNKQGSAYREDIVDPEFVFVLEPARVFEGTVTDQRTGDVIEGAMVRLRAAWFGPIEWEHMVMTDSAGRYRVEAASAYYYSTTTRADGYIGTTGGITGETAESEIAADGAVRRDIELTPAVRVRGRVVDGTAGRGVADAAVTYRPGDQNPFKQNSHGFWDDLVLTDADGAFVISALPGQGHLLAEVDSDEYIRTAFPERGGDTYPHGFIEIDVPNADSWEAQPVPLQTGVGIELEAVGPNGEAVGMLHVASLGTSGTMTHTNLEANRSPYRGGKHRLTGLSPLGTYRTFLYSPDLNAGAAIDLRYDPERPEVRQVRLQPAAGVRARLVYEDGTPAANLRVNVGFVATADDPETVEFFSAEVGILQNMAPGQMGNFLTDDNGEFEINRFIPETFVMISLNEPNFSDGTRGRRVGELSPGEVRDLGTLELKMPER